MEKTLKMMLNAAKSDSPGTEIHEAGLAKGEVLLALKGILILKKCLADGASRRIDQIDQTLHRFHSLDAFTKSSKEASGLMPGQASLA